MNPADKLVISDTYGRLPATVTVAGVTLPTPPATVDLATVVPLSRYRHYVERHLATVVVSSLLGTGYELSVYDGEEVTLVWSRDQAAILAAMFTTDDDRLICYGDPTVDGSHGWVHFVYGNDGWDVIHDYTTNLEAVLGEANRLADRYGE